ncbi:MAG TPA: DUF3866 family protein [Hydrogenispora sp.]|mgnify:CR=1 FL=1|jgi:hypothetical protein|nr:DUF3866 family protein [Hydrogenispora sp.]
MFRSKLGTVVRITRDLPTYQEMTVHVDGVEAKAIAYPQLTGAVRVGDRVWLNTTAVDLNLGTGGFHFVHGIEGRQDREYTPPGHIMKLRYTPWQVAVAAVEEEGSEAHERIRGFTSLAGTPVIVGTLHSMIAPAVLAFHAVFPARRVVYIMTDGAALPLSLSHLVRQLKAQGLLAVTITAGHAFGGDLEAVNIYSGLVAAKTVAAADLIVITMGPGIVGTGTKYGFSGIEQAYILEAVAKLGGYPIAIPRISFADPRPRHWGLSHHGQTVLGELTTTPVAIGLPRWDEEKRRILTRQFRDSGASKHHLYTVEIPEVETLLSARNLQVKTMGRGVQEDPAFFQAAAGAGVLAAVYLHGGIDTLPVWPGTE